MGIATAFTEYMTKFVDQPKIFLLLVLSTHCSGKKSLLISWCDAILEYEYTITDTAEECTTIGHIPYDVHEFAGKGKFLPYLIT